MFIHPNTPASVPGMEELPGMSDTLEEIPTEPAFEDTLFTFEGKTGSLPLPTETQTPAQHLENALPENASSREMLAMASFPAEESTFQTAVAPKEPAALPSQETFLRTAPAVAEKIQPHEPTEEPLLRISPKISEKEPFAPQKQETILRTAPALVGTKPSHEPTEESLLRISPKILEKEPFAPQKQETILRTAPALVGTKSSHEPTEEPLLRISPTVPEKTPGLQTEEPILRTAPALATKAQAPLQGEEPILRIAPAVAPLDPAPVSLEEPNLRTAPLATTKNQAQSAILPQDDGSLPLQGQVSNMPQPAMTQNEASAPAETAPSMASTNFVLQPAQAKKTTPANPTIRQDPRLAVDDTKMAERAKVSLEGQLDQANFQLSQGNPSKPVEPGKESYIFTSAAFKQAVKEEPPETAVQQRLNQQFRHIPASDPLETSQPLREFAQTMNFDASINPSGKSQDFEAPTAIASRNVTQRQAPHLAEVFTRVHQEERTEPSQTFTELDTHFDQMMTESPDKLEASSLKESRSASELNPARPAFKESSFDLEQIMSKVNIKDKGTQEVTLQLAPKELGNLKMIIRQEGNDLSVEMIVANPEVKQILEANLPDLRARFLAQEEASFDQLQFAVDVEQHSFSQSGQSFERGGFEEDYVSQKQQEAPAELPVSEQYRKAGYNSGVSVYA